MNSILQYIPLNYYVALAAILFAIGVMGVLFRRNAIIIFMCIELMLNAVNMLLTAFSTFHGDESGQVMVFFIMAVAGVSLPCLYSDIIPPAGIGEGITCHIISYALPR